MKVAVLFSGGKDSSYALMKSKEFHEVTCLVTLISENKESYMFQTANIGITALQAEAIGLPIIQRNTKGEKEAELEDLKSALREAKEKFQIEGVVSGALRSTYQAGRIQKICSDLDLWCFNPLWLKDQVELLNEIVEKDFKAIISGVFAFPLDEEYLGKAIDKDMITKLFQLNKQYQLNPAGEGGEIETTVLDAPFFKKRIEITESKADFKDNSGVFEIKKARLVEK